jgi:hypothetical protein
MAKSIEDGVSKIAQLLKDNSSIDEQQLHSWRDLRNKIDSLLLSTNVLTTNEAKQRCLEIDTMENEKRREFIATNWGPLYLQKVEPLLHQLNVLEIQIIREQAAQ